jgi:photosystem II stability/assembly factor-like uncharacterized protein
MKKKLVWEMLILVVVFFSARSVAQWVKVSDDRVNNTGSYYTQVILDFDGSYLYQGGSGAILRSSDWGSHWAPMMVGDFSAITVLDTKVFTLGSNGFLSSSNHGDSWTPVLNPASPQFTPGYIMLSAGHRLLVGSDKNILWASDDLGSTWKELYDPMGSSATPVAGTAAAVYGYREEYDGSYTVMRSTDGGVHWLPLKSNAAFFSNMLTADEPYIYAITANGVLGTTDNGSTWREINDGLEFATDLVGIKIVQSSVILSTGDSIYVMPIGGNRWLSSDPIPRDLLDNPASSLVPAGSFLFAGTFSDVWRRPLAEVLSGIPAIPRYLPFGRIDFAHGADWGITQGLAFTGLEGVATATGIKTLEAFASWLCDVCDPSSVFNYGLSEVFSDLMNDGQLPTGAVVCIPLEGIQNVSVSAPDVTYILEYDTKVELGYPMEISFQKGTAPSRLPGADVSKIGKLVSTHKVATQTKYGYSTVSQLHGDFAPGKKPWAQPYGVSTEGVVTGYYVKAGKIYMILQEFQLDPLWPSNIDMSFVPVDVTSQLMVPTLGTVLKVEGKATRIPEYIDYIQLDWADWGITDYSRRVVRAIVPEGDPVVVRGSRMPITNIRQYYLVQRQRFQGSQYLVLNWPTDLQSNVDFSLEHSPIELLPEELIRSGHEYTLKTTVRNVGQSTGTCLVRFYVDGLKDEDFIGETSAITLDAGGAAEATISWKPMTFLSDPLEAFYVFAVIGETSVAEANLSNNFTYAEKHFEGQLNIAQCTAQCPVTLILTDSNGKLVSPDTSEIAGAAYFVDDFDNSGTLDQRVAFPVGSIGTHYNVRVVPDSFALPTDRYTLLFTQGLRVEILADSVQIKDIPRTSYTFTTTGILPLPSIPTMFSLDQNYPNPFNPSTTIKYELPRTSHVSLTVYDILGREVSELVNEKKDAGVYEVKFDGSNLASGVYFYRLLAGSFMATKTMLVVK